MREKPAVAKAMAGEPAVDTNTLIQTITLDFVREAIRLEKCLHKVSTYECSSGTAFKVFLKGESLVFIEKGDVDNQLHRETMFGSRNIATFMSGQTLVNVTSAANIDMAI